MTTNESRLHTQIGGKYSRSDSRIFVVKQQLIAAGISVSHPIGDAIIRTYKGIDLAFDPEQIGQTIYSIERGYYRSISLSTFHTVCNSYGDLNGYLGESASVETCYAMMHNKPIFMLFPPYISRTASILISNILAERFDRFHIARIDMLTPVEIWRCAERAAAGGPVDYALSAAEVATIKDHVVTLLRRLPS